MTDHIPDPGKHRTLFYGHYANRVRGERAHEDPTAESVEEKPAKKRRCSATWARLVSKVFHADPLTCKKCGGKLKVIAHLYDQVSIKQILDHLGLSPPEQPKPPPAVHEVVRVLVDVFYQQIEQAITPKTRVLLTCHMTHWTGQMSPVKRLAALARKHDLRDIVDGAHGFMHIPINVADYDCDYYIGSLHKWLMAPPGNGFLYIRKSRIATPWPLTPSDEQLKNDIHKFEDVGTRTQANRVAMAEAITFNEGIGIEGKTARLRYLKERWANRFKNHARVSFLTSLDPAESCAIAAVGIAGADLGKVAVTLHDQYGIVVTHVKHPRFETLRAVPNIHMTLGEIDTFSEALEEVVKKA